MSDDDKVVDLNSRRPTMQQVFPHFYSDPPHLRLVRPLPTGEALVVMANRAVEGPSHETLRRRLTKHLAWMEAVVRGRRSK